MIAMKNLIPLTIFLLLAFSTFAQKNLPKLISAQKQEWAGGIAGQRGTHYYLTLKCNDTIWRPELLNINGRIWYKADSANTFSLTTKRIVRKENRIWFKFNIVANFSTNNFPYMMEDNQKAIQYIAFCNHNKKTYRLPIKSWSNLPFGNYP
jgi:hypothetical protein